MITNSVNLTIKCVISFVNTVKPVYNGHPWDSKKCPLFKRRSLVAGYSYKIGDQTGRCKQVAVVQRWLLTQVLLYV
jgi:hypothetical protein